MPKVPFKLGKKRCDLSSNVDKSKYTPRSEMNVSNCVQQGQTHHRGEWKPWGCKYYNSPFEFNPCAREPRTFGQYLTKHGLKHVPVPEARIWNRKYWFAANNAQKKNALRAYTKYLDSKLIKHLDYTECTACVHKFTKYRDMALDQLDKVTADLEYAKRSYNN